MVSVMLVALCTQSDTVVGSEPDAQGDVLNARGYSWSNSTACYRLKMSPVCVDWAWNTLHLALH